MNQPEKINETIVLEVTSVDQRTHYPKGYGKPAERVTFITLEHDGPTRKAEIKIIGDLPLGTRFRVDIVQLDDVTPATIQRGALPVIEDKNLLPADNSDVQ